jgi:protein gp37
MSDNSRIAWTEATWNPVTGCTRVSAACDHCYIERTPPFRMAHRRFDRPGPGSTTGVRLHSDRLGQPQKWRQPRRIFVCSQADLFHREVPERYIAEVFAVMSIATQHTFQVLTKRPARMRTLLSSPGFWMQVNAARVVRGYHPLPQDVVDQRYLPNVWCGVTAENQRWADTRIPILLDTPAAIRWVSVEPMLGPVDLTCCAGINALGPDWCGGSGAPHPLLDWVVCGGESGPGARPMHPVWAGFLRDQCVSEGTPFHFKQWGEWGPAPWVVRICDPSAGWQGTAEELTAAKADAEARGATHSYPVWANLYGHEPHRATHKPWSGERRELEGESQASIRRWGVKKAGRELDGRTWDEYPAAVTA